MFLQNVSNTVYVSYLKFYSLETYSLCSSLGHNSSFLNFFKGKGLMLSIVNKNRREFNMVSARIVSGIQKDGRKERLLWRKAALIKAKGLCHMSEWLMAFIFSLQGEICRREGPVTTWRPNHEKTCHPLGLHDISYNYCHSAV